MAKTIQLTQGQVAIVCDCHAHLVENDKWRAQWDKTTDSFYAVRHSTSLGGKRTTIGMHRVINNTPEGFQTDHENGDTLDNQCTNLRTATPAQNKANTQKYSNNTSGFKGVYKNGSGWIARLRVRGGRPSLGTYETPEDAARAYDDAAREQFGEFARTNFK